VLEGNVSGGVRVCRTTLINVFPAPSIPKRVVQKYAAKALLRTTAYRPHLTPKSFSRLIRGDSAMLYHGIRNALSTPS
jgi:hypothetical protein